MKVNRQLLLEHLEAIDSLLEKCFEMDGFGLDELERLDDVNDSIYRYIKDKDTYSSPEYNKSITAEPNQFKTSGAPASYTYEDGYTWVSSSTGTWVTNIDSRPLPYRPAQPSWKGDYVEDE